MFCLCDELLHRQAGSHQLICERGAWCGRLRQLRRAMAWARRGDPSRGFRSAIYQNRT